MKALPSKIIFATLLASAMSTQVLAEEAAVVNAADSSSDTTDESSVSLSANVAFVSDYRFRGWSQTATEAAVQGGFDLDFGNGAYAGVWASNVDFKVGEPENEGTMEMDVYAGYAGSFADTGIDYDFGYIYYGYPGSDSLEQFASQSKPAFDYQEVYGSLSVAGFTAGLSYSDDYWLESGAFYYISLGYDYELPQGFNLALHYGLNNFEYTTSDSNLKNAELAFLGDGEDSYSDWSVGVSKAFFGLNADLTYVATDVSDDACWNTDNCSDTLVFSLSKSL